MSEPKYSDLPQPMRVEEVRVEPHLERSREVIIVGGGIAGLSAAIYLGRALRDVLVIDSGESLAMWEPEVQNYLGFPNAIDGKELLRRGREQAKRYGAEFGCEEVDHIRVENGRFKLNAKQTEFDCSRLLLATGVYHLPPKIPCVNECIGKSMFFCKDCDGYRVQDRRVAIVGNNNEAVEYALGILTFTDCVTLLTNGETPRWDDEHQRWIGEYQLPVFTEKMEQVSHTGGTLTSIVLGNGVQIALDCLFTTRGDVFHNHLAKQVGAELDADGQVLVDHCQRTSVPGLYAAGCVTPANCQMIIAAGNGATAAQAINRDLFEESLRKGHLRRHREQQILTGQTEPVVLAGATV